MDAPAEKTSFAIHIRFSHFAPPYFPTADVVCPFADIIQTFRRRRSLSADIVSLLADIVSLLADIIYRYSGLNGSTMHCCK